MREIKFRAWDGEEMFVPSMITAHGDINKPNGIGVDNWVKAELMQFTGLKDKNGKEIYEGDILRYSFGDGEGYTQHVGEVVWDGCFYMVGGLAGWWTKTFKSHMQETLRASTKKVVCEVIGNIYENPELIK